MFIECYDSHTADLLANAGLKLVNTRDIDGKQAWVFINKGNKNFEHIDSSMFRQTSTMTF